MSSILAQLDIRWRCEQLDASTGKERRWEEEKKDARADIRTFLLIAVLSNLKIAVFGHPVITSLL